MNTNDLILLKLHFAGRSLAIHEFNLPRVSQNNLGTRLPEIAKRDRYVVGVKWDGEQFKEWDLTLEGKAQAIALAAKAAELKLEIVAPGPRP